MKNSMQQVPNAIPKVIRRTGGANSLELEKENFERGQVRSRNAILIKSVEPCVERGCNCQARIFGVHSWKRPSRD